MAEESHDGDKLYCYVEIPKGSRNKYEYDEELGAIMLDRFLFSSMVYPTDYGFIPDTLGEDGDALDAMVCVSEPTFPGCMIPVKAIALFRMEDDKGVDDKVLCVPLTDPAWNTLEELDDLPDQLQDEIAHFFSVYKDLEQKKVKVDGWHSRDDACKEIERARKRFEERGDEEQDADAKERAEKGTPEGSEDGGGGERAGQQR
jgi:inorganic pyrophosphatase